MNLKEQIKDLQKSNDKLRFSNLIMRMHLEVLAFDVNSIAAKKILAGYRKKMFIRKERELEGQN